MIAAEQFMEPALALGFRFWTGVPCSFLTPFINYVLQDDRLQYVGAASEGEAVGLAAGATLAGSKAVAICQNSGLGNMVNPLTSLAFPFRLPLLLIVTHRGEPGLADEPQHELMGEITKDLLDLMRIRWADFPRDAHAIPAALELATATMTETGLPFALVMRKDSVAPVALRDHPAPPAVRRGDVQGDFSVPIARRMSRRQAIETVADALGPDCALVATTGMTGRELYALGAQDNHLYVVGSMGCASAIAFGLRMASDRASRVAVIDGDGAALMKLGTLGTIGHHARDRFVHVLLDNESHDSTGGQATVSSSVDFAAVALACGYRAAFRADTPEAVTAAVRRASGVDGPILLHVKVARGSTPNVGRPTMTPVEVKHRFMRWHAAQSLTAEVSRS